MKKWLGMMSGLLLLCPLAWAETAEQLFATFEPALLQVRVMEQASSSKAAIGTGFVFAPDATSRLLVTNYHVVSEAVLFPEKYQLEALFDDQHRKPLSVLAVDVINDLALLSLEDPILQQLPAFELATVQPVQGATLYSLGNPHDLGMILVPGTYNGLQKYSYHPRIHFTGAINAGMSGGPTVNAEGQVVGVNVASGGNQLGFLVPAQALATLVSRYQQHGRPAEFRSQIEQQLQQSQQQMLEQILAADWKLKDFGGGKVPDEVVDFVRCWGESNVEKAQDKLKKVSAFCSQDDQVFLSQRFTTGPVQMQFMYLQAPELHPLQFFREYELELGGARPDNQANKDDVTPFQCDEQLVLHAGQHAKVVYCVRAYRHYKDLYDVLYLAAALDGQQQGLMSHYTLSGVSEQQANAFRRKFSEAVQWH